MKSLHILLFILFGLLFTNCSSFKNTQYIDDLYYNPNYKTEQDSLIDEHYNNYNLKYNWTYNTGFYSYYDYSLYDVFFDPYWIESYFWYDNYFYGYTPYNIYTTLRFYGFPISFARYYAYNYYLYNNFYMYSPYYNYWYSPYYNTFRTNNNVIYGPRKDFNHSINNNISNRKSRRTNKSVLLNSISSNNNVKQTHNKNNSSFVKSVTNKVNTTTKRYTNYNKIYKSSNKSALSRYKTTRSSTYKRPMYNRYKSSSTIKRYTNSYKRPSRNSSTFKRSTKSYSRPSKSTSTSTFKRRIK